MVNDGFPTLYEMELEIGRGKSIALQTCVSLVLIANIALYVALVFRFMKYVPQKQIPHLCWVTSIFMIISLVLTLMVFLPKSTEFLLASFRVYEALVISRFVELNLMWWGGEKHLMKTLGDNKTLRYNLPPCCCCLLCLNGKLITRSRIKIFRFMAAQMTYVTTFILFLQIVLEYSGIHDEHLSLSNPHTYLKFIARISFLFGFWSLFVFFKIEQTYKLLDGSKYIAKFTIMKLFFIVFIIEETIVEAISARNVIEDSEHVSGKAMAFFVLAAVVVVEALIFGLIQFGIYFKCPNTEMEESRSNVTLEILN